MPPAFAAYVECFKSATYDNPWLRSLLTGFWNKATVSDVAVEAKGEVFPHFYYFYIYNVSSEKGQL